MVTNSPSATHQLHRAHHGSKAAVLAPGAVGPGSDRPGDGLAVDVSLVGEGAALGQQWLAQVGDAAPGPDRGIPGFRVDAVDPGQERQIEQRSIRGAQWREGVGRPGHANGFTAPRRRDQRRAQLVERCWPHDGPGRSVDISRPVRPTCWWRHRSRWRRAVGASRPYQCNCASRSMATPGRERIGTMPPVYTSSV